MREQAAVVGQQGSPRPERAAPGEPGVEAPPNRQLCLAPAGAVVNQLADSDCRRLKRSRQIAQVAFGQRAWLLVQYTSVIWLEHRGIGRAGELEHRAT